MLKFALKLASAAAVLASVALGSPALAQDGQKTFYLLSHGGPSDAFWLDWNAGATKACDELKVTCKISFSGGDMAAQKEAFNSALAAKPDGMSVSVVGVGSNLLVRDGGIPGVVIRLSASFGKISVEGNRIRAGAAALDANVARMAADKGVAGLEFLRGVHGTIGGALRMNAGCYGREIKDVLIEATGLDAHGNLVRFTSAEMGFTYRKSAVPEDVIFIEAVFEGTRGAPDDIRANQQVREAYLGDAETAHA